MMRIVFYYNHYDTLGHSTRVFSLVEGLKKRLGKDVEIVVLLGGSLQKRFPFGRYAKVYQLPYSINKRGLFIEEIKRIYKEMISSGKLDKMLQARFSVIKKVLKEFQPNIFITEYFPLGQQFWTFELPHILKYIKENSRCRIVASCGYLSWTSNAYKHIKDFYDALLIHSPERFIKDYRLRFDKSIVTEMDKVFKDFRSKIHFTGFVPENSVAQNNGNIRQRYLGRKKKKLIFVSRGGGIVSRKIIATSILLAKRNKDLFFVICCGPATPTSEFNGYKKIAKGIANLKLYRHLSSRGFQEHLQAADLSINMAGYNTTVKLFLFRKKTIFIPYRTVEQKWRADIAKQYLSSKIISNEELNISTLERNVLDLLKGREKRKAMSGKFFEGIPRTIEILRTLV